MNQSLNNLTIIEEFINNSEKDLSDLFISRSKHVFTHLKNIQKIFKEEKLSPAHFSDSTGIGYEDISREKIDSIFAKLFKAEKAMVRMQFVSGTHAISSVLFGILRPGDTMASITGSPYDTLEEVIGLRGKNQGSLIDFGIKYKQIELCFDSYLEQIQYLLENNNLKLVFIQKSCGYSWRRGLSNVEIQKICSLIHSINPDCICFVDNCYGELVEESEPIENGADIIAGSLIKNLGGTIVPTGGYVIGNADLVEMSSCRLTAPGIGSHAGINFGLGRLILQGLYFSPQTVAASLNCADLIATVFKKIGYKVKPEPLSYRSDTIQSIQLNDPYLLKMVCQSFQNASPVDSFLSIESASMNGYDSNLLMAGGTFIQGSTSEFSADAPVREPYNLFVQGGTHISHAKIALIQLLFNLLEEKLICRDALISP